MEVTYGLEIDIFHGKSKSMGALNGTFASLNLFKKVIRIMRSKLSKLLMDLM